MGAHDPTAIEALRIADEHVRWALGAGFTLEEIVQPLNSYFLPKSITESVARFVVASTWFKLQVKGKIHATNFK